MHLQIVSYHQLVGNSQLSQWTPTSGGGHPTIEEWGVPAKIVHFQKKNKIQVVIKPCFEDQ